MADTIDMKEDGEIESDGEVEDVYKKLDRPSEARVNNNIDQARYYSDSSVTTDSDGETPKKKIMKRLEKPPQATAISASRSKNGSLWKNMLQEETLMETLKTCDVSSTRKRKFERGAESYDFENHRVQLEEDDLRSKITKRRKRSGNDSSSSNASSRSNQKFKKKQSRNKKLKQPKFLSDITAALEGSDEDFARDMAEKLEEEKSDLIIRVVSVIGKEASLNLYKITQKIEREGGMLTMNKFRRRTPGGIFLFLLKSSDKIDEQLKKEVFTDDSKSAGKSIADRKMSSEQTEAKDPPNSPVNSEFTEVNGKATDPVLVSKILNFSTPTAREPPPEEVLELDCNFDDMDTF